MHERNWFGARLRYSPGDEPTDPETWFIEPTGSPTAGPSVAVFRTDDGQWNVIVNTENMEDADPSSHTDHQPHLSVTVNCAEVYDLKPPTPPETHDEWRLRSENWEGAWHRVQPKQCFLNTEARRRGYGYTWLEHRIVTTTAPERTDLAKKQWVICTAKRTSLPFDERPTKEQIARFRGSGRLKVWLELRERVEVSP